MKQFIILVQLILIGSTTSVAQSTPLNQVPLEVSNALLAQHPDARNVAWSLIDHNDLQARFLSSDSEPRAQHAIFTYRGEWVETRSRMDLQDLPEDALAAQKSCYRGYTISEVYRISTRRHPELYELRLIKRRAPQETIRIHPQSYLITQVPRQ